jgi:hypothetical protein
MIAIVLSLILFLIFTILGGFHFYWLFGGVWGLKKVIPTRGKELKSISVPKFATLMVGLVLVSFGLMYLIKSEFISVEIPSWLKNYGYWFIPLIFILRAIGDFKYVGIFKKIQNTKFAKADNKIFIPLCLIIGILGILIILINN